MGEDCKTCTHFIDATNCAAVVSAKKLYNAGYRKQSEGEWVSVEERLPKGDDRVLVYLKDNPMSYTRIDTDRLVSKEWVRWGDNVSHWKPLPEPPKKKDGTE